MKEFFKRHNIVTKLLSLILAIVLWLFVMSTESLDREITFSVPLMLEGTQTLQEEHQLAVIDGQDAQVTVRISGKTPGIFLVNRANITASVDVSTLDEAKTYEDLPVSIALPQSNASLKVKNLKPEVVSLTLDEITSIRVPVHTAFDGAAQENYLLETAGTNISSVNVSGPQSILNTIASAFVTIPVANLTETQAIESNFVLVNSEGQPVDTRYLTYMDTPVQVTVEVYKVANVPLTVELRESREITQDMVSTEIAPKTIQVYGEPSQIDALQSISLGTIDLATAQNEHKIPRQIRLPSGVTLMNGEPTTAWITTYIDGMELRNLTLDEVNMIDTNTSPNKPDVTLRTTSIDVTLRGKSSALSSLNIDSINVSVQFDSSQLSEGAHRVPVAVTLPTSAITVIDYTETVTIVIGSDTSDSSTATVSESTSGDSTTETTSETTGTETQTETETQTQVPTTQEETIT